MKETKIKYDFRVLAATQPKSKVALPLSQKPKKKSKLAKFLRGSKKVTHSSYDLMYRRTILN